MNGLLHGSGSFLILPVPGLLLPCNDQSAQSKFSPHPRERHNVGIIPVKKKPRAYWDRNRTAVCDDRRTVGSIWGRAMSHGWLLVHDQASRTRSPGAESSACAALPCSPRSLSGGSTSSAPLAALGTIRPSRKRAEFRGRRPTQLGIALLATERTKRISALE